MGEAEAAAGIAEARSRIANALIPYAAGAVAGALMGLLGVYVGRLAASVNLSFSDTSRGWGALASSGVFALVVIFGVVLVAVGSKIGELAGACAAAVGAGVAVGLCAGAAGGMAVGAGVGAAGGLAGAYLGLGNVVPLVGRELAAYFYSPIAYMLMVGFLVLSGIWFYWVFGSGSPQIADMRPVMGWMRFLNFFVIPLLTMRLLAEESRSGTLEVLMTAPVTDVEVVLGKYLGSLLFYICMLLPTLLYVACLFWLSPEGGPDMGGVWMGYLGLIMTAGVFLAGGLLVSSFTSDQIVAAVLAFVLVLAFFFVGMLYQLLASRPDLQQIVKFVMIDSHFASFEKGLVDSRDLGYFVSITVFLLFATVKSVESRKWR